jgi:hypothetical protein
MANRALGMLRQQLGNIPVYDSTSRDDVESEIKSQWPMKNMSLKTAIKSHNTIKKTHKHPMKSHTIPFEIP